MRGEVLSKLLGGAEFNVIDTNIPIESTGRIFKSIGWRFFMGPMINRINTFIHPRIRDIKKGDLVWVDKGVFIHPEILVDINQKGAVLVHYTPDTAFTHNRSNLFFQGIPYYDACVTTKSFELADYNRVGSANTIFCTQGYLPELHRPLHTIREKEGICFIGLAEPDRVDIIRSLIAAGLPLKLGGKGWVNLAKENVKNRNFTFLGERVFGENYVKAISSSKIGLGLLSKRFPELHTTRTFEIPACGTALATEDNHEIRSFYNPEEVIYFMDGSELISRIKFLLSSSDELERLTINGTNKIRNSFFDYPSILKDVLTQLKFL